MPHKSSYGDFEIGGEAALHAGDRVTYVTNTGTVLFVDSHYIDLKQLMPQLKQHNQYKHSKRAQSISSINPDESSTNVQSTLHGSSSPSISSSTATCQTQTQTQVQLYEAYACKSAEPKAENSDISLAKARLQNHLDITTTPQDKILNLVTTSTQHLHLQSPSDFRPSALLRQSIGLAGYVAVSLVTIGVDAARDRYRQNQHQTSSSTSTSTSMLVPTAAVVEEH